ncbi:MAG: PIG-L family deacetylase [Acidimicrobiaceae bacterium]|nr:PIG-L family deacetylase [Acidimicrobiaceae bacterium]
MCAHPDDESFGLGAVLTEFASQGARTSVLCFTRGEASTLHVNDDDLATVRSLEFARAAAVLGVSRTGLLGYPDGHLSDQPLSELTAHAMQMAEEVEADLLLTFDEGGITGHPDHVRATQVAQVLATTHGVPVLAWLIADGVAETLNHEFGATFVGRSDDQHDFRVEVDRTTQSEAIDCHESQSLNPVLRRRLELSGDLEPLRWLTSTTPRPSRMI